MKTTLLVMTLNEIDGMKAIMPRIKREWFDQIIVVDGGSTDGTIEYAKQEGYSFYVQKRQGFRHAYFEVMPLVEGDVIVTFSPDGNSIPELIPELIEKMREGYDMVIVSRYLGKAKSDDDDLLTGFGNWLFTKTVNILSRVTIQMQWSSIELTKKALYMIWSSIRTNGIQRLKNFFRAR